MCLLEMLNEMSPNVSEAVNAVIQHPCHSFTNFPIHLNFHEFRLNCSSSPAVSHWTVKQIPPLLWLKLASASTAWPFTPPCLPSLELFSPEMTLPLPPTCKLLSFKALLMLSLPGRCPYQPHQLLCPSINLTTNYVMSSAPVAHQ